MSQSFARLVFALTAAFFGVLFLWPIFQILKGGFIDADGHLTRRYLTALLADPTYLTGLRNSFLLACAATTIALLIAMPLAFISDRFLFPAKGLLSSIVLIPMILPPFVGAIGIKGHNVMKGYWNKPDATADAIKDGWFHSGDMAKVDDDGYFFIVDRKKDMIIRGGYNVYPREIEEVLMTHEDVSLAAVIGVPHESHGEEVKAFVILNPGASTTAEELVAWGKEQMANYKYPRIVEVVENLPMTATGKILKRELA